MIKKLFFLIPISLLLLSFTNVYAYNSTYLPNLTLPEYANGALWPTETTFETFPMAFQADSTNAYLDSQKAFFYGSFASNVSNDYNGISISFPVQEGFIKGNTYNMSFVICNKANSFPINAINIGNSTGSWQDAIRGNNATINNWSVVTTNDYVSDGLTFTTCRNVVVNFTSNYTGNFVALRFRSNTVDSMGGYIGLIGYIYDNQGKDYTTFFNNISAEINNMQNNIDSSLGGVQDAIGETNDKLDDIGGAIGDTNNKLDNLEDSLTSEAPPNKLGDLNNSAGWLPAGPVDSLLNLPFTMLRSINNNLGGTCQPVNLTLPFVNSTLTLPCLSSIYESIDGLSIWINTISIIASGFILYSYLLKLYKWVDDTLTFRENNNIDNWGGL